MSETMTLEMLGQKSGCPMQSVPPTATATKTTTKERNEADVKVEEQRSRRQVPSGERAYHAKVIAA